MARTIKTTVELSDDLDGSTKGVETHRFSVNGTEYEIDLGPKNSKAFNADLARWTETARKVKKTSSRRRAVGKTAGSKSAEIRAWAAENGIDVPARGRISGAVIEQYENA